MAAANRRPRGLADPLVASAVNYRRGLTGAPRTRRRALAEAPQLHAAHRLREDEPAAAEIEARLLAGQSISDVGDRLGLEPGSVWMYRQMFFDVGDLHARDWIFDQTIVEPLRRGEPDAYWYWRWAAWCGGPAVLELLIDDHRSRLTERDRLLARAIRTLADFLRMPAGEHEEAKRLSEELRRLLDDYRRKQHQEPAARPGPKRSRRGRGTATAAISSRTEAHDEHERQLA